MKKKIFLIILIVVILVLIIIGAVFLVRNRISSDEPDSNTFSFLSSDLARKYKDYTLLKARYSSANILQDIPYPVSIIFNKNLEISTEYLSTEPLATVLSRLTDSECNFRLDSVVGSDGTEATYEDQNYSEDFFQDIINNNKENLFITLYDRADTFPKVDYIYITYNENIFDTGSSLIITAQCVNDDRNLLLVYDDDKSIEYPLATATEIVRLTNYPAQSK